MSLVIRHVLPRAGAHAEGKSTPQSQIWKSMGRETVERAVVMFAYRPEGETTGV